MNTTAQYSELLEQEIKTAVIYDKPLSGLYDPIVYGLGTGGKRLRPMLTLMAATACGADPSQAMPAALAVEMFHNFTLLHDDVMDSSPTRRGKPSVWKKWDIDTAILSGDTLFALCIRQIMRLPSDLMPEAMRIFTDTAIQVMEGQQYDMDFEKREHVTLQEYTEMIRLKTSVLLGCATALGAIAAGADTKTSEALYTYGEELGLAFQIQDDLLDIYGDPATFGKPIGGDILNAKKTFPLISCLATPQAQDLRKAMEIPAGQKRIDTVRDIYDRAGIPATCRQAITMHTDRALAALTQTDIPSQARQELAALAQNLADRQK